MQQDMTVRQSNACCSQGSSSAAVILIAGFAHVYTWIVAFFIKLSRAPASRQRYFAEKARKIPCKPI
jgi:hypothetical protein